MRLIHNAIACYRFTGAWQAGARNLAHSMLRYWAVRPITNRSGDFVVLWLCVAIGCGAFLLNIGFFD